MKSNIIGRHTERDCESRNSDIEIPVPLNRVRFMGIDFGSASSLDLLPKSIPHTYRLPSR